MSLPFAPKTHYDEDVCLHFKITVESRGAPIYRDLDTYRFSPA